MGSGLFLHCSYISFMVAGAVDTALVHRGLGARFQGPLFLQFLWYCPYKIDNFYDY